MRVLPFLVPLIALAGLPGIAAAQTTWPEVQKAAQPPLQVAVPPAALGVPADPVAPKLAMLTASKSADANLSDFDTDKIDGNAETFAPLAMRQKAPGQMPDGVTEADLGQPANPDAAKLADLAVSHTAGRVSTYDEDKVDGNDPPPPPMSDRQKAPAILTATLADEDLGILPDLPLFKTADLAVSHADAVGTVYDEDKIIGNGEVGDTGPLSERRKLPSMPAEGTDPASLGHPAPDTAKTDLAISKAETGVASVEDNDKIADNPYVVPPLAARQKLPSVLLEPVVDADMGQPAPDTAKTDLAISKAEVSQPTMEDNDKIVGNPVIAPPLMDRSKAPSYNAVTAGLSDADLGLPLAPEAAKVAGLDISKAALAAATEYDDDKIAGNSFADPAYDGDGTDSYAVEPSPDLIAAVQDKLDDPLAREALLEGIAVRALAPPAVADAFNQFVTALFDTPEVRTLAASEIARVFMEMGLTPDNPLAVGRMAAEYLAVFGEPEARRGMQRLPRDVQRDYLSGLLRIADNLPPAQCGPFLDGTMDAGQERRLMLEEVADWTEEDRNTLLIQRAAAAIVEIQGTPFTPMPDADAQIARVALGAAALTAIDAAENGTALLAAYGDPSTADPADLCAVHRLILQGALANTGPDAEPGVRYLVEFGWQR